MPGTVYGCREHAGVAFGDDKQRDQIQSCHRDGSVSIEMGVLEARLGPVVGNFGGGRSGLRSVTIARKSITLVLQLV